MSKHSDVAMKKALDLLAHPPATPDVRAGYLDLLGEEPPPALGLAPRLMRTRALPLIYERWWRPLGTRVVKGFGGPSMSDEYALARSSLSLAGDDIVLDVACGPGNFTRRLARTAGLVVGIDAAAPMLARAVEETDLDNVAYVRGDGVRLPFRDGSVDAVCCFAALNLFDDPYTALDNMLRVLSPGGRIAILTSCRPPGPFDGPARLVGALSGMTIFGRHELTTALESRGCVEVWQRVAGATQFVSARWPG